MKKGEYQGGTALIEIVLNNHPSIDGHKRTGYVVNETFLLLRGRDMNANQEDEMNCAKFRVGQNQI